MQRKITVLTVWITLLASLTAFAAKEPVTPTVDTGALIHIGTEAEFTKIMDSAKPALVDFYADWCGPCRMLAPTIEKLADDYKGKANIAKVNVDNFKELAKKYNISGIPCVILFKNGKEINRIVGKRAEKDYTEALDKALK